MEQDLKRPPLWHPLSLIATWFGSGRLPGAPGTWGSLTALPFAWVIMGVGGPLALASAALALFAIGWPVSSAYARRLGRGDPGEVVVDEVVGLWLTLIVAPLDPVIFAIGFVFFRILDILKPWPVSFIERKFSGGLGIMLDDVIAGAIAAAILGAGLRLMG